MGINWYDVASNCVVAIMHAYVSFVLIHTFCWGRRRYRPCGYAFAYLLLSFAIHLARRFALYRFMTSIPMISIWEPLFFVLELLLLWCFFDTGLREACVLLLALNTSYLVAFVAVKAVLVRLYAVTFSPGFPFFLRYMHEIVLLGIVVLVLYLGIIATGLFKRAGRPPRISIPFAVGLLLPSVLFCAGYFLLYPKMYGVENHYSALVSGTFLFMVNVATWLLYIALYHRDLHLYYLNQYYEEQKLYFKQVTDHSKSVQQYMHDERKHYVHILGLARQQEYARLEEYVLSLNVRMAEMGSLTITGNLDVDSVLNAKALEAEQTGCRIKVIGKLPGRLRINPVDICILLGNCLDNAIYACQETDDREIPATFSYHKRMLLIRVENACPPGERRFRLTEEPGEWALQKKSRGIGLEIMETVAKKYSGEIKIVQSNHRFITEIFLHDYYIPERSLGRSAAR